MGRGNIVSVGGNWSDFGCHQGRTVEIYFEAILEDSISGEILGLVVRKGFGESLENESMVLTRDNIYPQLDRWAKDARNIAKLLE